RQAAITFVQSGQQISQARPHRPEFIVILGGHDADRLTDGRSRSKRHDSDSEILHIGLVISLRLLTCEVAESLIAYLYVTVSTLAERTGKSFQAANNTVRKLVELGVLTERTGRTHGRVFEASGVVTALTRP
ncbi:MAG: hypothetical protein ACT4NY_32890, partial [Pseudonocardiales bacterium]